MRTMSSLQIRKTRCINSFERFDWPGNFEVQLCRILDLVLFAMVLDDMNVIIVILINPGVPISLNDERFRFIWQFRSSTVENSRSRVNCDAFGWDECHYCNYERSDVKVSRSRNSFERLRLPSCTLSPYGTCLPTLTLSRPQATLQYACLVF